MEKTAQTKPGDLADASAAYAEAMKSFPVTFYERYWVLSQLPLCSPVCQGTKSGTFEIKFDGYRCIVVKRGSAVTLFSRNEKVLNKRFPKVVDALASLGSDFVLDGELVS